MCTSKSGVSVACSLVELLWSSFEGQLKPTGLQSQMLWGLLLLLMLDRQAGEPDTGVRTLILVGDPQQYNYFPVCGLPTWGVWDLNLLQLHPSYHLTVASCLWMLGIYFGGFQPPPVNCCTTDSCNFGPLKGGDEHLSFYFAIWNQKLVNISYHCAIRLFLDSRCSSALLQEMYLFAFFKKLFP